MPIALGIAQDPKLDELGDACLLEQASRGDVRKKLSHGLSMSPGNPGEMGEGVRCSRLACRIGTGNCNPHRVACAFSSGSACARLYRAVIGPNFPRKSVIRQVLPAIGSSRVLSMWADAWKPSCVPP